MRTRLQGVTNIVRFNWPFYLFAFLIAFVLYFYPVLLLVLFHNEFLANYAVFFFITPVVISLLVSYYIYDRSQLYQMNWLPKKEPGKVIVNIHAGFDETSAILFARYKDSELKIFDFYDPEKHTETSIERARNAYPPYEGTLKIATNSIPLDDQSVNTIYLIFAAHEIRDDNERVSFFKELHRILKPDGQIIVAEHLRDFSNFIAYTIGFFHFLPISSWHTTFSSSDFKVSEHYKHTPFVNIFTLEKYGNSF